MATPKKMAAPKKAGMKKALPKTAVPKNAKQTAPGSRWSPSVAASTPLGQTQSGGSLATQVAALRATRPTTKVFFASMKKVARQLSTTTSCGVDVRRIAANFIYELCERLADCAWALRGKGVSVNSRSIQSAVRLILPWELSKHAAAEGTKAVCKFSMGPMSNDRNTSPTSGKKKAKRVSPSARAGLQFAIGRCIKIIKSHKPSSLGPRGRVSKTAGVYLAATAEYMTAEVLELTMTAASRPKRGKPKRCARERELIAAMESDVELAKIFARFRRLPDEKFLCTAASAPPGLGDASLAVTEAQKKPLQVQKLSGRAFVSKSTFTKMVQVELRDVGHPAVRIRKTAVAALQEATQHHLMHCFQQVTAWACVVDQPLFGKAVEMSRENGAFI